eukprot:4148017-Ditylum_brightwellii.AAC.1
MLGKHSPTHEQILTEITDLSVDFQQSLPSTIILQDINELREENKVVWKYFHLEHDDSIDNLFEHQNTIEESFIKHMKDTSFEIERKMVKISTNISVVHNSITKHLYQAGNTIETSLLSKFK